MGIYFCFKRSNCLNMFLWLFLASSLIFLFPLFWLQYFLQVVSFLAPFAFAPFALSSSSQLHASLLCLNSSQHGVGASKTELHQLHIRQQKFPPKPPTANSSALQPVLRKIRHLHSKRLQTYSLISSVGQTWKLRKPWRRPGGCWWCSSRWAPPWKQPARVSWA